MLVEFHGESRKKINKSTGIISLYHVQHDGKTLHVSRTRGGGGKYLHLLLVGKMTRNYFYESFFFFHSSILLLSFLIPSFGPCFFFFFFFPHGTVGKNELDSLTIRVVLAVWLGRAPRLFNTFPTIPVALYEHIARAIFRKSFLILPDPPRHNQSIDGEC